MADGETHEMRHAVCADRTCPSLIALTEMQRGQWEEDPDLEGVPDDVQIKQADKLVVGMEFFADYGYPNNSYCTINDLDEGVWEFKLGAVRFSFYDTDGQGAFTPKFRIRDRRDAEFEGDFWWLPGFDEFVRVGHCFGKNGQKTTPEDIEMTKQVRREDLDHDRP